MLLLNYANNMIIGLTKDNKICDLRDAEKIGTISELSDSLTSKQLKSLYQTEANILEGFSNYLNDN